MQIRTTCPQWNNYYIRIVDKGWNGAIQGKPTKTGANVLSNCVGYANGRFAEIQDKNKIEYQFVCNAENFIEKAKQYGLKVVSYPTLGGIMCWQKGNTLSGNDGAGHVAIVERIDNENQIYTSESAYGSTAFYNVTRSNSNGRWGMGSAYKFRGCIINPEIGDKHYENKNITFIKEIQAAIGAKVDGIVGTETRSKLPVISKTKNNRHKVVKIVQKQLIKLGYTLPKYGADGIFGNEMANTVKQFQKANGLVADGIIGQNTWKKLLA